MAMKVIALAQQKGGVGKSSLAIQLAALASSQGRKVALLDMDVEQGTAWKWGERRGGDTPFVVKTGSVQLRSELRALESDGYELVFIDLPGRNAPDASSGLAVADFVMVPCRPVSIDIEASVPTVRSVRGAKKAYAFLVNIAPTQANSRRTQETQEALSRLGHLVCPVAITQRVDVHDSISTGQSISEFAPKSPSVREFTELLNWLDSHIGS